MSNFSNELKLRIWKKAQTDMDNDPDIWRKDSCGAWINFDQYGKEGKYGWEVDHVFPESRGGKNDFENLRAMHWSNNRSKGDDFPGYTCSVTSNGNKNVTVVEQKTVNNDAIKAIKALYPLNSYLQKI